MSAAARPTLTVLLGQPDRYSTSFQTRQLVRALGPWFTPSFLPVPAAGTRWGRGLGRVWVNYLRPLVTKPRVEYLLYGNDGTADLRHWMGRRIVYWYDAPWDWRERAPRRSQWVHWLRYRNVIEADQVFAVSTAQVEVARSLRPGREASAVYLPVGVDCDAFDPATADPERARRAFALLPGTIVGYLGYLGYWGGRFAGDVLLEAAPWLLARHKVHFLVVGSGPALPRWKASVRAMGLERHFTFTGFVPDHLLTHCIAAMDVCVDTLEPGFHSEARSETKLKQYMAMGRACVATAIGENVVDLDQGRCGVLAEPGAEALARAIGPLCEQPRLRAELGGAARRRARAVYDWRVLARRFTEAL